MSTKERFRFTIGPDPYENGSRWVNAGNGRWSVDAKTLSQALEMIFTSMPFPAEQTGRWRGIFLPGISIPELMDEEVVQVWSDLPEALEIFAKSIEEFRKSLLPVKLKDYVSHLPHRGDGGKIGIMCEIPVFKIAEYMQPVHPLLGMGEMGPGSTSVSSPVGATVRQFMGERHLIAGGVQLQQYDVMVKKYELEKAKEVMREEVARMNHQMFLADTYLHGTFDHTVLREGQKGKGPYRIFQKRQFLDKEIALLANLTHFDFNQLRDLDKWLLTSGKIWRFLPYERTILVTRVRSDEKDYGCPWRNAFENMKNMMSVVWIRDGENVSRLVTEVDFKNVILPNPKEAEKLMAKVNDAVFTHCFCSKPEDRGHGILSGVQEEPPRPGYLKKEAWDETEPYEVRTKYPNRFPTVQEWMDSPDFTPKIQIEVGKAVNKRLMERNKQRMSFLVLLQGIVDNSSILDVPKGTNLFNWDEVSPYFTCVMDYTYGLPDGLSKAALDAFMRVEQLRVGDVIAVDRTCFTQENRAYSDLHCDWYFYRVVGVEDDMPVVMHHRFGKHYPHEPVKTPERRVLPDGTVWVRMTMPKSLAERALDDREWKENHLKLVPLFAAWDSAVAQADVAKNFTKVKLNEPNG